MLVMHCALTYGIANGLTTEKIFELNDLDTVVSYAIITH